MPSNCVPTQLRAWSSTTVARQGAAYRSDAVAPPKAPPRHVPRRSSPSRRPAQGAVHRQRRALRQARAPAKALMRASVPDGDLGATSSRGASASKLERLEARRVARPEPKTGASSRPTQDRATSRPAVKARRRTSATEPLPFAGRAGRRCTAWDGSVPPSPSLATAATVGSRTSRSAPIRTTSTWPSTDYGRQAMARHRRSRDRVSEASAVSRAEPRPSTLSGSLVRLLEREPRPSASSGSLGRLLEREPRRPERMTDLFTYDRIGAGPRLVNPRRRSSSASPPDLPTPPPPSGSRPLAASTGR